MLDDLITRKSLQELAGTITFQRGEEYFFNDAVSRVRVVEEILAETEQGRGILGVVDGFRPRGVEDEAEVAWRKNLLRQIGYKL